MAADVELRQTIEPGPLADPAVVPDGEEPGVLDVDRGLDDDSFSYASAKGTEEETFQAVGRKDGVEEHRSVHHQPQATHQEGAPALVVAPRKTRTRAEEAKVNFKQGSPFRRRSLAVPCGRPLRVSTHDRSVAWLGPRTIRRPLTLFGISLGTAGVPLSSAPSGGKTYRGDHQMTVPEAEEVSAAETTIRRTIAELLRARGAATVEVRRESRLTADLGMDSLELAELSAVLEDALGHDPFSAGIVPETVAGLIAYYDG